MPVTSYHIEPHVFDHIFKNLVDSFPHLERPTERAIAKIQRGDLYWDGDQWLCKASRPASRPYKVDFDSCTCPSHDSQDYTILTVSGDLHVYCKHKIALLILRTLMRISIGGAADNGTILQVESVLPNHSGWKITHDNGAHRLWTSRDALICEVKPAGEDWNPATEADLAYWMQHVYGVEEEYAYEDLFRHYVGNGMEPEVAADAVDQAMIADMEVAA